MSETTRIKFAKALIAASLLSITLVACGSDDNADDASGGNNAPTVATTNAPTQQQFVSGAVQGTTEAVSVAGGNSNDAAQPTVQLQMVPATPLVIRRGSDGSMSAAGSGTPAASPEASPAASPESATPTGN